jgi:hypothetical protein
VEEYHPELPGTLHRVAVIDWLFGNIGGGQRRLETFGGSNALRPEDEIRWLRQVVRIAEPQNRRIAEKRERIVSKRRNTN